MVNVKSAIAFGLLAATASAATLKHDKRHVHHRRHNKQPCTTGSVAPFPVGNSTMPAGTGAISSTTTTTGTSTTQAVVTVSVVPVPVSSAPVEASSVATQPTGSAGAPPPPAGSVCGVATSYVTVQQTVTVTAGSIPETTSPAPVVVPSSSSSSVLTTISVAPPAVETTAAESTPVAETTPAPAAGGFLQGVSPSAPEAPVEEPSVASSVPVSTPTPVASSNSGTGAGAFTSKKFGTSWIPGSPFSSVGIGGVSWIYNWEQAATGIPEGVQFVPTLHDADKCSSFKSSLEASGSDVFKHFNEPDMGAGAGGSLLSPAAAADLHKTWIRPLANSYTIGMPAVTSNNIPGTSGTGWITSFIENVGGCDDFDFGDFHFYGGSEDVEKQAEIFLGYVDTWLETMDTLCPNRNLPIWITEFSAGPVADGDAGKAAAFMKVAGPKLFANPRVARFAYFFPQNTQGSSVVGDIQSALKNLVSGI